MLLHRYLDATADLTEMYRLHDARRTLTSRGHPMELVFRDFIDDGAHTVRLKLGLTP